MMALIWRIMVQVASLLSLLCVTLAGKTTNANRVPKNAVLLSQVSALTLRQGKATSARRLDPVPQLECVGPSHICKLYQVEVMRCTNEGADYDAEDIQWSCKASMPEDFKLGSTEVGCEGYESSADPYVLKGSCAVQYRLLLTDKGEAKYGGDRSWFSSVHGESPAAASGSTEADKWAVILFFAFLFVVLFIIARGIWTQARQNPPRIGRRSGGSGGGGGGGGSGGDDDPPPPYDDGPPGYSAPRPPKSQKYGSSRASSSRTSTQRPAQPDNAWRPGFWTGAAAGAAGTAAAYMAGNRGARPAPQQEPRRTAPQTNTGGWFGGGGGRSATGAQNTFTSDHFSPSSTQHESTGFGGTRRR